MTNIVHDDASPHDASQTEHHCVYRTALEEIDGLDPADFMTGQEHLLPAFRRPNLSAITTAVVRIVNRTLHGTDEHGKTLE